MEADIYEDLDFTTEEGESEVEEVDLPTTDFWQMKGSSVADLLRVVSLVSKSNLDVISKSIFCSNKGSRFSIRSTDKDVYFAGKLDFINDSDRLEDDLIFDSRQLIEVAKSSRDLVIYKKEDQPYVNLLNGFYPLEKFSFDPALYKYKAAKPKDYTTVNSMELLEELNLLAQTLTLAGRVEDRKIYVKDCYAYGFFLTVASRLICQLPDMTLRFRDVEILKAILSLYSTEPVMIWATPERNFFQSNSFMYSSTASKSELSQDFLSKLEPTSESLFVNGRQFYEVLRFLDAPTTKMAAVFLKFGKDGAKVVTSSRKGAKSEFVLTQDAQAQEHSSEIQVSLAKKVFQVIKDFTAVSLTKEETYIKLQAEDLIVVMASK